MAVGKEGKVPAALPPEVRKGSAFSLRRLLFLTRLCLLAVRGAASHISGGDFTGRAQPFRTSVGTAARAGLLKRGSKGSFLVRSHRARVLVAGLLLVCLSLLVPGCFPVDEVSPYYGRVVVPRLEEFRWSDGGLPQVFDPAFAAAPPDTDVVRALFEGLTDYDSRTLAPVPAVARRWESSSDGRVWTFYLRDDAHWSNGEKVTANDFVRSWERTIKIGQLSPHTELLGNIAGATVSAVRHKPLRDQAVTNEHGFGAEALSDQVL